MDKEKNQQPEQSELDLEFNQIEPITPKKISVAKPSLLDKAKSLATMLRKKKNYQPHQEPQLTDDNLELSKEEIEINANKTTANESDNVNLSANSEYKPTEAKGFDWKHPENWALLQKLPQRHRRIVAALLAFIILLLLFLWLKPSSTTVDVIHQQNQNSLPIEFQPLDQNLVVEESLPQNETIIVDKKNVSLAAATATNIASNVELPQQTEPVVKQIMEIAQVEQSVEIPTIDEPVKSKSTTNMVHQEQQLQSQKFTKPSQQTAAKQIMPKEKNTKQLPSKGVPVVEAKPTTANISVKANSKTLTINKGVSLMQVFRDNNLNISDVNAMTKANGAGNVLSSFKPGDKVQVSVQSNGRVGELRLQDGSRFVRQTDGSYIYHK